MKKIISVVSLYAFPMLALAAEVTNFDSLFNKLESILDRVLPFIMAIAVIYFVYNALMYMIAADEEKKGEAKSKMIYGIIGLFVMVSVWGLVNIIGGTFSLNKSTPGLPDIDFTTTGN